jgi:hypothetical protein
MTLRHVASRVIGSNRFGDPVKGAAMDAEGKRQIIGISHRACNAI